MGDSSSYLKSVLSLSAMEPSNQKQGIPKTYLKSVLSLSAMELSNQKQGIPKTYLKSVLSLSATELSKARPTQGIFCSCMYFIMS